MKEAVAEAEIDAVVVAVTVAAMEPAATEEVGSMVICEARTTAMKALLTEAKEAEAEQRVGPATQAVMSVLARKGVAAEQAMEVAKVLEAVASVVRMGKEVAPMATEAATLVHEKAEVEVAESAMEAMKDTVVEVMRKAQTAKMSRAAR